jgi:hypothetical protein
MNRINLNDICNIFEITDDNSVTDEYIREIAEKMEVINAQQLMDISQTNIINSVRELVNNLHIVYQANAIIYLWDGFDPLPPTVRLFTKNSNISNQFGMSFICPSNMPDYSNTPYPDLQKEMWNDIQNDMMEMSADCDNSYIKTSTVKSDGTISDIIHNNNNMHLNMFNRNKLYSDKIESTDEFINRLESSKRYKIEEV